MTARNELRYRSDPTDPIPNGNREMKPLRPGRRRPRPPRVGPGCDDRSQVSGAAHSTVKGLTVAYATASRPPLTAEPVRRLPVSTIPGRPKPARKPHRPAIPPRTNPAQHAEPTHSTTR